MRMHRDASYAIPDAVTRRHARCSRPRATAWDEAVAAGEAYGYRNAQATVLAPTGTISFLMDCDTTGVEPDFSLVKFKELVGGGTMTIANRTVPMALRDARLRRAGRSSRSRPTSPSTARSSARPACKDEHLPVFDVAVGSRAISHMGHIKMMGAVQPFISGAISKTVNMPQRVDGRGHRRRLPAGLAPGHQGAGDLPRRLQDRAGAAHRRAGRQARRPSPTEGVLTQDEVDALIEKAVEEAVVKAKGEAGPARHRMPRERQSITHKFNIGGHEGYITAGMYEDGTVGEIFITDVGKEGSTLRGMMNSFATAISIALQYGVPLETLVQKFAYMRFEPEGITQNPEIPFAKSMPDYIMRWLASPVPRRRRSRRTSASSPPRSGPARRPS